MEILNYMIAGQQRNTQKMKTEVINITTEYEEKFRNKEITINRLEARKKQVKIMQRYFVDNKDFKLNQNDIHHIKTANRPNLLAAFFI